MYSKQFRVDTACVFQRFRVLSFCMCLYRLSYEFFLFHFFTLLIGINEWLLEYDGIHKQNTNQRMKTILNVRV